MATQQISSPNYTNAYDLSTCSFYLSDLNINITNATEYTIVPGESVIDGSFDAIAYGNLDGSEINNIYRFVTSDISNANGEFASMYANNSEDLYYSINVGSSGASGTLNGFKQNNDLDGAYISKVNYNSDSKAGPVNTEWHDCSNTYSDLTGVRIDPSNAPISVPGMYSLYTASRIFQTHLAAGLFNNSSTVENKLEIDIKTALRVQATSSLSAKVTDYCALSGSTFITLLDDSTHDLCGNKLFKTAGQNMCSQMLGQLLKNAPQRFIDINAYQVLNSDVLTHGSPFFSTPADNPLGTYNSGNMAARDASYKAGSTPGYYLFNMPLQANDNICFNVTINQFNSEVISSGVVTSGTTQGKLLKNSCTIPSYTIQYQLQLYDSELTAKNYSIAALNGDVAVLSKLVASNNYNLSELVKVSGTNFVLNTSSISQVSNTHLLNMSHYLGSANHSLINAELCLANNAKARMSPRPNTPAAYQNKLKTLIESLQGFNDSVISAVPDASELSVLATNITGQTSDVTNLLAEWSAYNITVNSLLSSLSSSSFATNYLSDYAAFKNSSTFQNLLKMRYNNLIRAWVAGLLNAADDTARLAIPISTFIVNLTTLQGLLIEPSSAYVHIGNLLTSTGGNMNPTNTTYWDQSAYVSHIV